MVLSVIVKGDSILWIDEGGHYGSLILKTDEYVAQIAERAKQAKKRLHLQSMVGFLSSLSLSRCPTSFRRSKWRLMVAACTRETVRSSAGKGIRYLGRLRLSTTHLFLAAPEAGRSMMRVLLPGRRFYFEDGKFCSFLFDLDTAAETGNRTTGNAERGALSLPSTGTSNLVMSAGVSSREEMIGSLDRGVVVYGVLGGGQSNLLAGDYAFNVMLGFLVEGGEVVGRLTDTHDLREYL